MCRHHQHCTHTRKNCEKRGMTSSVRLIHVFFPEISELSLVSFYLPISVSLCLYVYSFCLSPCLPSSKLCRFPNPFFFSVFLSPFSCHFSITKYGLALNISFELVQCSCFINGTISCCCFFLTHFEISFICCCPTQLKAVSLWGKINVVGTIFRLLPTKNRNQLLRTPVKTSVLVSLARKK